MSAKLARLEQQEQEFMAKYNKKATSVAPHTEANTAPTTQSPTNADCVPKKTKRKKEKRKNSEAEDIQDSVPNGETDRPEISADGRKEKKKKKSSKEQADADTVESPVEGSAEDQNTEDTKSKKKKKKKHSSNQKTEESNKNESQEDFKDAITTSTEEPIAKHTMDTVLELQKALKKKKKKHSKKNLLEVENADSFVVNGHHTDITNECEENSEVIGAVKEQCTIDQQVCTDLDSKKKKKKKKKCSKSKEDISSLSVETMQNEETGAEMPGVTGTEERTERKSKAKKRKTGDGAESGIHDCDSTALKKRKKGKRKDENCWSLINNHNPKCYHGAFMLGIELILHQAVAFRKAFY